jgi:hypothetical protein
VAILDSAVAWWHADRYSGTGAWQDESGNGHHAQLGSTSGADTNDPEFLEYAGTQYLARRDPTDAQQCWIDDQTDQYGATDDFELIADFAHQDITDFGYFAAKRTGGGTTYWGFGTHNSITRFIWQSAAGQKSGDATVNPFTSLYSEGERFQMKVTLDVDNGAGGYDLKFWHRSTSGDSWSQLGATITGGATTDIADGTADVSFGSLSQTSAFVGDLYRVTQKVGIDGTTVLDVDFTSDCAPGDASFTATVGGTVNIYRGSLLEPVVVNRNLWLYAGDDYHVVADHDDLDFNDESFSYYVVARHRTVNTWDTLVSKNNIINSAQGYCLVIDNSERPETYLADGSSRVTDTGSVSANSLEKGTGSVFDATANTLEVFRNGVGTSSPATGVSKDARNAAALHIGATSPTPSFYHYGPIVGVAIFRSALSDADVATLHTELLADQTVAGGAAYTQTGDVTVALGVGAGMSYQRNYKTTGDVTVAFGVGAAQSWLGPYLQTGNVTVAFGVNSGAIYIGAGACTSTLLNIDTDAHTITLLAAPVSGLVDYDVVEDIYSEAKRLWLCSEPLSRLTFPFRSLGGDPLGGTLFLGKYVFIRNDLGWHIHPYDASHQLTIIGNLYQQDPNGRIIFEPQAAGKTINVIQERSSLTQLAQIAGSGLTVAEALDLERIRQALLNEQYTDPATGLRVILDDDDISLLTQAGIWEDVAKLIPYKGEGVERMARLFST